MFRWEFPGGPVVRAQAFTTRGLGSVPAREATASHTAQPGKKVTLSKRGWKPHPTWSHLYERARKSGAFHGREHMTANGHQAFLSGSHGTRNIDNRVWILFQLKWKWVKAILLVNIVNFKCELKCNRH